MQAVLGTDVLPTVMTLVAVFVAVALGVGLLVQQALAARSTERVRLREVTRGADVAALPEITSLSSEPRADLWQRLAPMLGLSIKEFNRLRSRLTRAGFEQPSAPIVYAVCERVLPFAAALAPLLVWQGPRAYFGAAVAGGAMFFTPALFVDRALANRRQAIENGLADALDLLVVCIEAGCGLDQAIVKTSDELAIAYPVLANELRMLTTEIRAGKPRLDAFKALAQRTKVDDVRSLVAMLIQTDRFGTSIGQALRTHADSSREKRRQRAEEKAQKIAVKLVFPLVLCFFPAFYVVVLGPAIITFVRSFSH
jgi:tight adherence protein C